MIAMMNSAALVSARWLKISIQFLENLMMSIEIDMLQ